MSVFIEFAICLLLGVACFGLFYGCINYFEKV